MFGCKFISLSEFFILFNLCIVAVDVLRLDVDVVGPSSED